LVAVYSLSGYRYLGDDRREILHDGRSAYRSRTDFLPFGVRYPRDPHIPNFLREFYTHAHT